METAHSTINQVLVTLFNHILRIEERALSSPGLSIREVHVIECVCESADSRITSLAQMLRITTGSLSVAVSTLERKGYLLRVRRKDDRRMVDIVPTEKALAIQEKHKQFHEEMTAAIVEKLSESEKEIMVKAMDDVYSYFTSKENGEI